MTTKIVRNCCVCECVSAFGLWIKNEFSKNRIAAQHDFHSLWINRGTFRTIITVARVHTFQSHIPLSILRLRSVKNLVNAKAPHRRRKQRRGRGRMNDVPTAQTSPSRIRNKKIPKISCRQKHVETDKRERRGDAGGSAKRPKEPENVWINSFRGPSSSNIHQLDLNWLIDGRHS